MKFLLKIASLLFHPIWMPLAGALLYFLVSPRFFPAEVIKAKLIAIAIMTIFIPVVFYYMMKTLGKATSHLMIEVRERKWPLMLQTVLLLLVLKFVLDYFDYPELYFFFAGIFVSTFIALLFVFFGKKISLHMTGLSGLTVFIILLSVHFNLNLIYTISFLVAITGLTASSRLHYNAHSNKELVLGIFTGMLPQIAAAFFWL